MRLSCTPILYLSLLVLYYSSYQLASASPAANNLKNSLASSISYFGGYTPETETTTGFSSTSGIGHALGYSKSDKVNGQTIIQTDALSGYAYGSGQGAFSTGSGKYFKCEVLQIPQCVANNMYCTWNEGECRTKQTTSGVSLKPLLPAAPYFFAKLNLHAKGTVRTVFVDIDTRCRLGQMYAFRARAVEFFKKVFGLDFGYFNTFEGAQMIPFKWTDEMYLQIQNAYLPPQSDTIPERNRVLVDGFLVKPLAGETVVLGGLYASSKGKNTVFLDPDEILIFLEYRVVDEYNRLYHTFSFYLKYPLKTNRVGIAGWTAAVVRRDPETDEVDPTWGIGVDQGILEIVTFDDLQDFAFTSVLTFDGEHMQNTTDIYNVDFDFTH